MANNETTFQSSENDSFDKSAINQTIITSDVANVDEKLTKNLSNVFRNIDAKKIQSDTKDIEDESGYILQNRRVTAKTTVLTTTTVAPSTTVKATTPQTNVDDLLATNTINSTNVTAANETSAGSSNYADNSEATINKPTHLDDLATKRRRRRHRQRRYKPIFYFFFCFEHIDWNLLFIF